MATFGDLKTKIAAELVRDDLGPGGDSESITADAIKGVIDDLQAENWWFLRTTVTAPTVAAQNYITRPATIEEIDRLSIPSLGRDLDRVDLAEIEMLDEPTVQTGQPCIYAEGEAGGQLRLWPTPNAIYTVKAVGTKHVPELALDADTNVWTTTAYYLVKAMAKKRLNRFSRDPDGEATWAREEVEARATLVARNMDRQDGPVKAGW